jgi:hypothetical protein
MAPKRKLSTSGNNALTYWHTEINALKPESAEMRSHHEFIKDAHRWGEAMVRAELKCMADDGRRAADRYNLLHSRGGVWYARGYRFFLLPRSVDAPKFIAGHSHANERLARQALVAPHVLVDEANAAADKWFKRHASGIIMEAAVCVEEEARRRRRTEAQAAPQARRPTPPPKRTPSILASPNVSSPATAVASKPPPLALPGRLAQLLERPSEGKASAPRACIREQVEAAFRDERIMRAWDTDDGSGRRLTFLEKRAHALQLQLRASGLQAVYGGGTNRKADDAALESAGLGQIGRGGFNTIWGAKRASARLGALLPPEVAEPFHEGHKLVLRAPHSNAEWVTREFAVGEATNMLFTALCGLGPRVAALSFARRLECSDETFPYATTVVRYKIFAFLECATQSVERRYALQTARHASAITSRSYYDALLVSIYQLSHEGFVHLDATLRNFVDFYPLHLPTSGAARRAVKVIDVEPKCFRRLCPTATTEWRYLFLFNLLSVLVFLKVQLAGAWDPAVHWLRVRRACERLIAELPGKANVAALTLWQGTFVPWAEFPDLAKGAYKGDTHAAAALSASHQLQHYLMQQPLDWCNRDYVRMIKGGRASVEEVRKAKDWYERTYRGILVPSRLFFLRAFEGHGPPRRFVEVAFEFLETPHAALQRRYASCAAPAEQHRPGDARNTLLGIA